MNIVPYLDIVLRGRQASQMPQGGRQQARRRSGGWIWPRRATRIQAEPQARHRPLLGYLSGLGKCAAYALVRSRVAIPRPLAVGIGLGVIAGSDLAAVAFGVIDASEWRGQGWIGDTTPQLTYGTVTAVAYEEFARGYRDRRP